GDDLPDALLLVTLILLRLYDEILKSDQFNITQINYKCQGKAERPIQLLRANATFQIFITPSHPHF
ncbi:hypothetical protein OAC89_06210, partial [Deltaproteobacteria bacterium]|nr:hypothetical protein [Deltaproteobacteria bacterium]